MVEGVLPDLVQFGVRSVVDVDENSLLQVLPLHQVTVTLEMYVYVYNTSNIIIHVRIYIFIRK